MSLSQRQKEGQTKAEEVSKKRKHTALKSQAEQGLYGAAYGAKKEHKPMPSYVPPSVAHLSMNILKGHLEESKGRNLPKKVKGKR